MFNTLGELRAACRELSMDDGPLGDGFFKDAFLNGCLREAEREFARESRCFVDSSTGEICSATVTQGNPWTPLDGRIIRIRRAMLYPDGVELLPVSYQRLDGSLAGNDYGRPVFGEWESQTGTPEKYVTNLDSNKVRLFPIPAAAGFIKLTVERLALAEMLNDGDAPEVDIRYRQGLAHKALALAYQKDDAATARPDRIAFHEGQFMDFVNKAKADLGLRERSYGGVRINQAFRNYGFSGRNRRW